MLDTSSTMGHACASAIGGTLLTRRNASGIRGRGLPAWAAVVLVLEKERRGLAGTAAGASECFAAERHEQESRARTYKSGAAPRCHNAMLTVD